MLARNYDYSAWEQERRYEEEQRELKRQQELERRRVMAANKRHALLRNAFVVASIILVTYSFCVYRSSVLASSGQELRNLRTEEKALITKNSELKIEVEQLKGPGRIIGLAEKNLGLSVARNNIYVKASQ